MGIPALVPYGDPWLICIGMPPPYGGAPYADEDDAYPPEGMAIEPTFDMDPAIWVPGNCSIGEWREEVECDRCLEWERCLG
jgi:hypothetical protein